MHLFEVTILAKKTWMDRDIKLQWIAIADTGEGAIEQVTDDMDFTGVEITSVKAVKKDGPIVINIQENF